MAPQPKPLYVQVNAQYFLRNYQAWPTAGLILQENHLIGKHQPLPLHRIGYQLIENLVNFTCAGLIDRDPAALAAELKTELTKLADLLRGMQLVEDPNATTTTGGPVADPPAEPGA